LRLRGFNALLAFDETPAIACIRMPTDENLPDPVSSSPSMAVMEKGFMGRYRAYLIGIALLLCALTFYYFAVLRVDYAKTVLLDLVPGPDAIEYFAQAKGLLTEGRPQIQIGYDKLPSRYPFGYPVLMLPWLKVLPDAEAVMAPFRTNQTIGLLLLLAVFATYAYLAMPLTGGFAVLLLATLPGFFTFCRSSMSDISASALVVLAFIFVYLGLKEERRWEIYLAAFFLGLSLNVRMQSLFFGPLLLAMTLFPSKGFRFPWLAHCGGALFVFALAASPVLALNTIQFGSPFKTGYDFWVPSAAERHLLFSFRNIPRSAATLWSQFALGSREFNGANIFGTGTFFVPAFALLVLAGVSFIRTNRFATCAFLAGFTYLALLPAWPARPDRNVPVMALAQLDRDAENVAPASLSASSSDVTVTYRVVSGRYYLPLLILLVAVAALPVRWAAKNLTVGKGRIAAICILGLFVAACIGYPSQSGSKLKFKSGRFQAWDAVHFTSPPRRSTRFIAMNHFIQNFRDQPGIVLSDIDPVYLNALLPKPFVAAPLDQKHRYRFGTLWRYGRPEAIALVKKGLDQSIPIYALFVSMQEMNEKASRLPALTGYQWTMMANSGKQAVILKLASATAD
jgi:hypothetical protein